MPPTIQCCRNWSNQRRFRSKIYWDWTKVIQNSNEWIRRQRGVAMANDCSVKVIPFRRRQWSIQVSVCPEQRWITIVADYMHCFHSPQPHRVCSTIWMHRRQQYSNACHPQNSIRWNRNRHRRQVLLIFGTQIIMCRCYRQTPIQISCTLIGSVYTQKRPNKPAICSTYQVNSVRQFFVGISEKRTTDNRNPKILKEKSDPEIEVRANNGPKTKCEEKCAAGQLISEILAGYLHHIGT